MFGRARRSPRRSRVSRLLLEAAALEAPPLELVDRDPPLPLDPDGWNLAVRHELVGDPDRDAEVVRELIDRQERW